MAYYIGVKQVQASPCERNGEAGYEVTYPDGYKSWSPKEAFEKAYLLMETLAWSPENDPTYGTKVTQVMVDEFIKNVSVQTVGEKTTVVKVELLNGFEIVESSSCVEKANYSEDVGAGICSGKIKDKIWYLLGFTLQWARHGLAKTE